MSKLSNTLSSGRPSVRSGRVATLASLTDEGEMKRVNFELRSDQHTKLKIFAAKQNKTIKEILTEFVEQLPE